MWGVASAMGGAGGGTSLSIAGEAALNALPRERQAVPVRGTSSTCVATYSYRRPLLSKKNLLLRPDFNFSTCSPAKKSTTGPGRGKGAGSSKMRARQRHSRDGNGVMHNDGFLKTRLARRLSKRGFTKWKSVPYFTPLFNNRFIPK